MIRPFRGAGRAVLWLAAVLRSLPRPRPALAATSAELTRDAAVAAALGGRPVLALPWTRAGRIAGWGRRPSGRRALRIARRTGAAAVLLEDGPLGPPRPGRPRRSVLLLGPDPDAPDAVISRGATPAEAARARALIDLWRAEDLSKMPGLPDPDDPLPEGFVLVADQLRGDLSIPAGGADAAAFDRMLAAAVATGRPVVVKAHPESRLSGRAGHFDAKALRRRGIRVIDAACHPGRLIRGAAEVFVVTSGLGLEALLAGRPVRTFGMPIWAGRGLTRDALPPPPGRAPARLEDVAHALLVGCAVHVDGLGRPATPEAAFAEAGAARRAARIAGPVRAVGFRPWKRAALSRFCPAATVLHRGDAPLHLAWGDAPAPGPVLRVEDGFLRSAGLGADLVRPLSWCFDDRGLHYDPARPSALERLIAGDGAAPHLVRAAALRDRIVREGATKYNLGGRAWRRPAGRARVVLVPGQVATDASLRLGAVPPVTTNAALLAAVRRREPGAHVVWRPHPDVTAGLRDGGPDPDPADWDETAPDVALETLLHGVDAVHTMTSLTGFEALLRGREVICHGRPFYAGWGLTTDLAPIPRRRARPTLDALTAAALILYPTYVCPATGEVTTPERALDALAGLRRAGAPAPRRRWRRVARIWSATGLRGAV